MGPCPLGPLEIVGLFVPQTTDWPSDYWLTAREIWAKLFQVKPSIHVSLTCSQWWLYMSCRIRKPSICICENKDADQLRGNCETDQCLCFRYTDSTIPLFKSEISSFYLPSETVQPGLCRTWSKPKLLVFSSTCSYLSTLSMSWHPTVG